MKQTTFLWQCLLVAIFTTPFQCLADEKAKQEELSFEVTVKNSKGDPVEGAKLNPWAIMGSDGHGNWPESTTGGLKPEIATTNSDGTATVKYPKYKNVDEHIKSIVITVSIDHPDHPFVSHESVSVPGTSQHTASLPAGSAIHVNATIDGGPLSNKNVRAIWSGGRPGQSAIELTQNEDKSFRIPPIKDGAAEYLFLKIEGNELTHISKIVKTKVDSSKGPMTESIQLQPMCYCQGNTQRQRP